MLIQDQQITYSNCKYVISPFMMFRKENLFPLTCFFIKNGPLPLLSFIFGLFSQTLQILQQYRYEKKCPSSIRCQDSNPRPLERESPPIITRPGLPKQTPCLYVCGQRLTVVTSNYLSFSSCFGPTVDLLVVKSLSIRYPQLNSMQLQEHLLYFT